MKDLCTNCGLCCILPSGKDCPNLERLPDGKTKCKIYFNPDRLGTDIGEGQTCHDIMQVKKLFVDCPYNEYKIKLWRVK